MNNAKSIGMTMGADMGGNSIVSALKEREVREGGRALNELLNNIQELQGELFELNKQLDPILTSVGVDGANMKDSGPLPPVSDVTQQLMEATQKVAAMSRLVKEIKERSAF
jgi:hypothetical protein